ncbi:8993_t:CDS:2, partial [Racocetra persica]
QTRKCTRLPAAKSNCPRIVVGVSDFKKLRLESEIIVDKSLLIKAILESPAELEVNSQGERLSPQKSINRTLFVGGKIVDDLEGTRKLASLMISSEPKFMEKQGKYPVIVLDLKDAKGGNSYQEIENKIKIQVFNAFAEHNYLKQYLVQEENALENTLEKEQLTRCFLGKAEKIDLEYDTVINDAYLTLKLANKPAEFDEILKLFRTMLGSALKGNIYPKQPEDSHFH